MKPEYIKQWLKEYNHDRKWLAEQLDAAPKTINNWLGSSRGIPDKAKILIEQLIESDRLRDAQGKEVTQALTLEFSSEDFDSIEEAARRSNKKIRTWATDTLREVANQNVTEVYQQIKAHDLMSAEDPAEKKPNADVPEAS